MATGETTFNSLSAAEPTIIGQARIIKAYDGTWMRTCEVQQLGTGNGNTWNEFAVSQVQSADIGGETLNGTYQQITGTLLTGTPSMTQVILKITDETMRKLPNVVTGKFGSLAGQAMATKKDQDYLALFSSAATTTSPGTGNPLSHGHIAASVANIQGNTTEPSMDLISTVIHGFQKYDLQIEVTAPVGTYMMQGLSEEVYRKGWSGTVAGSNVFTDGNITVNSTPDARGATHSRGGVVALSAMAIKTEKDRDLYFGGGADVLSMVDDYGFFERTSGTTQVWLYTHLSDATAPAS